MSETDEPTLFKNPAAADAFLRIAENGPVGPDDFYAAFNMAIGKNLISAQNTPTLTKKDESVDMLP